VQEAQAAARLQEILGDKTFDEFIASKQAEAVDQLRLLNDQIAWFLDRLVNPNFVLPDTLPINVIPLQHGTSYVPRTDLYKLHEGEMVLPRRTADMVRGGAGGGAGQVIVNLGGITVHANGTDRQSAKRLVDTIEGELVERFRFGRLRAEVKEIVKRT